MPELLTAEDIRKLYRLASVKTVYRWHKEGALPPALTSPGHKLLWRESDTMAMIKKESAV
jgi:predicted site-specific integrase-resolvase